MIKFSFEIPIIKLDTQLPDLTKVLEEEMLNTRARLIADTTRGQRADGGGIKPYSRTYTELIDSGYIFGKSPGNHTPNLTATGELLRSLVVTSASNTATLAFQGTHAPTKLVSHKHAEKKRAVGGIVRTARNHGYIQRKLQGLSQKRGGSGSQQTNAQIAQDQYAMGRTGWISFAQKDIDRITARIKAELAKLGGKILG